MTPKEIDELKKAASSFMNHVHWVTQSFNLLPDRNHYGTAINYVDLQEFRDEFCEELINTIPDWIYSQSKAKSLIDGMILQGRTLQNANAALTTSTFRKFRNRDATRKLFLQGQFGELLLFNFLLSFFDAVPLVRKMPLTTSTEMERFGADAMHYALGADGSHILYLGEAKTYTSKYKFEVAFADGLESILNTYNNHRKEIDQYIYDDFIDPRLIDIAQKYKNGTLTSVEVHLVSIISYHETKDVTGGSEAEIKRKIIEVIENRGKEIDRKVFDAIKTPLHPRFNYIIFPIWELNSLLDKFQTLIGK